jgi:integrase
MDRCGCFLSLLCHKVIGRPTTPTRAGQFRSIPGHWRRINDDCRRSIPIPERLIPILTTRLAGRRPSEPAITSPLGSRLGLENWKRSVKWRQTIIEIGRPTLRVHDLRHTYASLARRAGADLRLLQKTMGHASITVTSHIYADLYDDELDDVAWALDALDDRPAHER